MNKSFYKLSFHKPSGEEVSLADYQGKVLLIVNTATKCGLAPQFDGLEQLHQKYKDQGLVVLGFPCNQFLNQEPETNDSVEETCRVNHGVTFQLTAKIKVNGPDAHPIYKYLKKAKGGLLTNAIKWNFTKFLVDHEGYPFKRYAPNLEPEKLEADIKILISKIGQETAN
jgi:glutathione peroxidase